MYGRCGVLYLLIAHLFPLPLPLQNIVIEPADQGPGQPDVRAFQRLVATLRNHMWVCCTHTAFLLAMCSSTPALMW